MFHHKAYISSEQRKYAEISTLTEKRTFGGCRSEDVVYSASQMLSAERRNRKRLRELADISLYSIPYPKVKKIVALKNHITGVGSNLYLEGIELKCDK